MPVFLQCGKSLGTNPRPHQYSIDESGKQECFKHYIPPFLKPTIYPIIIPHIKEINKYNMWEKNSMNMSQSVVVIELK
jgi:hypothetical protein